MVPTLESATPFYAPYILRGRERWLLGKGESHGPGVYRLCAVTDGVLSIEAMDTTFTAVAGDVCLFPPSPNLTGTVSEGGHVLLIVFVTDPRALEINQSGHTIDSQTDRTCAPTRKQFGVVIYPPSLIRVYVPS